MTKTSKFVDSFWVGDFTSTAGFDCLCKRMKDGRRLCKDFEEYLKQRSRMETEYSKSLQKLLRGLSKKEGFGNLGESWREMLLQGEKITQIHDSAAAFLMKLSEDIKKFQEDQKTEEKRVEELVKRQHGNKVNLYNKTLSLQKSYISKCREKDSAVESYDAAKKLVTHSKEVEKAKIKMDKSEETMLQADASYRASVDNLESARDAWEKQMSSCCEVFQKQDEDRLTFLRKELWSAANVDSKICVDIDNCCEIVRLRLEKCDIDEDIADFVNKNTTGSDRPAEVFYENYYKSDSDSDKTKGATISRRPQQPLPPATKPRNLQPAKPLQVILPQQHKKVNSSPDREDGDYSFIGSPELKTVIKPYRTQTPVDFQVRNGDVVQILKHVSPTMVEIQIEGSKKIGIIPKSCIGL